MYLSRSTLHRFINFQIHKIKNTKNKLVNQFVIYTRSAATSRKISTLQESFKMVYGYRYRRKGPKVDASIFDSALTYTRRSDASKKREENCVSTFGRFRLWNSFESSPVSVETFLNASWSVLIFGDVAADRV